jgi:hypothetical protein
MSTTPPATPVRSPGAPRLASAILGGFLGLVALGLLAFGVLALWGDAQKDDDGYLSTSAHRFSSSTYAIATDELDVDLGGPGSVIERDRYGRLRLQATSSTGKPLFVGIAPTREVTAYLRGSAHSTVADVDTSPFRATYELHEGAARPALPAGRRFWAASAQGTGRQTVTWPVQDGAWSIVVMNADASRGVDARVSAGADVPFLDEVGWILTGGGSALLLVAGGLVLLGARAPRAAAGGARGLRPAAGPAAS